MIKGLTLNEFTNFEENTFSFSKGINVFIGKNGCGKTHLLKVLAAALDSMDEQTHSVTKSKDNFGLLIANSLRKYFMPDALHRIVRRQQGVNSACVQVDFGNTLLSYKFSTKSTTTVTLNEVPTTTKVIEFLYIPPVEVLSHYRSLLGFFNEQEVDYDKTYLDLVKALSANLTKGKRFEMAREMIKIFEEDLSIEVIKEANRFYVKDSSGKIEAHLVAEGLRKIASIMYLALNGQLRKNSVLFWDEPEANLNPKLISVVSKFIQILSRDFGVQSFISTHDYLLTTQLSLASEYGKIKEIEFFCLDKTNKGIEVYNGASLKKIKENPILEQYVSLYDMEMDLFTAKNK